MKAGVFIGRFQPLHNGHLQIINKMMEENDKVLVFFNPKGGTYRNPFSENTVKKMLTRGIIGNMEEGISKLEVQRLPDLSFENDPNNLHNWGPYFYWNSVSRLETRKFTFYYGDKDHIDYVKKWFDFPAAKDNVEIKIVETSFPHATEIRQMILKDERVRASFLLPEDVFEMWGILRKELLKVMENPKDDYQMK